MKKEDFLNNYTEDNHNRALNYQNVYVSHSGDYRANPIRHVHNACEIIFVEEGGGVYHINGEPYMIEERSVLIIGGTDPHSRIFTKTPCIRYGLTILPSFLHMLPIINSYMNVFRTQSPKDAEKLVNIDEDIFQRLIQLVLLLHEETQDNGDGRGDMVYALLLEMTIILKRLLFLEKQEVSGTYKMMSDIKNYIDLHYAEELSLKELSGLFYLQPNTISKNFGKIFGKNVNNYINSVRVANAVRFLEEEEISITELADRVGYSSVNTFLRQFREKMGVSPLQYKKRFEQSKENSHFESLPFKQV
ncbi:MAG: AraC family transcriptional regulator [Eubacteriales bacterium]|nr:AraC family transcriptional regulator [Eubacteriales bacterium]